MLHFRRLRRSATVGVVLSGALLVAPLSATGATPSPVNAPGVGRAARRSAVQPPGTRSATAVAGAMDPAALRTAGTTGSVFRPAGVRMRSGPTRSALYTSNWSGLGGTGSGIAGAEGAWTVPAVEASTSARYSASWVGVDGENDQDLIQTGTEQDTADGYYAWWEILPAYQTEIVTSSGAPAPVAPGDHFTASVQQTATPGKWAIGIGDITRNWFFEQDFNYTGPGDSAEWIEEAPGIDGGQSTPADFGKVDFSRISIYEGTAWASANLTAANKIDMEQNGRIRAFPNSLSAPGPDGQRFADVYATAPPKPTDVTGRAENHAVVVSWKAPVVDGGARITGYKLREWRAGKLQRTLARTATTTTVRSLVNGAGYTFSVAAINAVGYTSGFSGRSGIIRPRG